MSKSADDMIKELISALEAGIYGMPVAKLNLLVLLRKLGIKSAKTGQYQSGGPLKMESLESSLKGITFDDTHIKLWNKPNSDSN